VSREEARRGARRRRSPDSSATSAAFSWFTPHTATRATVQNELAARFASPRKWRRPLPPQPISPTLMRSGNFESSAIRQRPWRDVEQRFVAGEVALELVDHEAEEARAARGRDTGNMRAQEDIRQVANRAPDWYRLR